jgi:MYXO-CTERM domain-containing protein
MKPLTLFLLGIALAAGHAVAADSSFQERAAPHPALYSFVDVFRLTLSGPMPGPISAEPSGEAPIRVAAPQAQPGVETRFSVSSARGPDKWLLLLAGLALAAWVARRRQVHTG